MDLIERVARVISDCEGYVHSENELARTSEIARAAIAEVLDAVEAHLSAVQYDPAPYTAMRYRLAQLRKEVEEG